MTLIRIIPKTEWASCGIKISRRVIRYRIASIRARLVTLVLKRTALPQFGATYNFLLSAFLPRLLFARLRFTSFWYCVNQYIMVSIQSSLKLKLKLPMKLSFLTKWLYYSSIFAHRYINKEMFESDTRLSRNLNRCLCDFAPFALLK